MTATQTAEAATSGETTVLLEPDAIAALAERLMGRLSSACEQAQQSVPLWWTEWPAPEFASALAEANERMDLLSRMHDAASRGEPFNLTGPREQVRATLHDAYLLALEGVDQRDPKRSRRQMRYATAVADYLDSIGWPAEEEQAEAA